MAKSLKRTTIRKEKFCRDYLFLSKISKREIKYFYQESPFTNKTINQITKKVLCSMLVCVNGSVLRSPGKRELKQAIDQILTLLQDNYSKIVAKNIFMLCCYTYFSWGDNVCFNSTTSNYSCH